VPQSHQHRDQRGLFFLQRGRFHSVGRHVRQRS
jgi:hypothetical protein